MSKNQKHTTKTHQLYKNTPVDELMRFKTKLRKNFVSTITDTRFKIPADTKIEALIKWLEISIIFDSTIDDILKTRDWRESERN